MAKRRAAPQSAPRRLAPMRNSSTFKDYVLEQLAAVPALSARAMFGGVGFYSDRDFFGILAADVLYFKVDDGNRRAYERAGMTAFRPFADRPMSMNYFTVPIAVVEDAETLRRWASDAIAAARRKADATGRGGRPRSSRPGRSRLAAGSPARTRRG